MRKSRGSGPDSTLIVVLVALVCCVLAGCGKQALQAQEAGGQVHGFIVADLSASGQKSILLPDADVFLKDAQTGKEGPRVKSDASGRYVIPEQTAGKYLLCAAAPGFAATCESNAFSLGAETYYPKRILKLTPSGQYLVGSVVMSDGSPCFRDSAVFHSRLRAEASLVDSNGGVTAQASANSQGFYILHDVPQNGAYRVQVKCGDAEVKPAAQTASVEALAASLKAPQRIVNRRPAIVSLIATLQGKTITTAPPGTTVTVTAKVTDADGDQIHYKWTDGQRGFTTVDAASIEWKLQPVGATNILFMEASDGKGGFAEARLTVVTGPRAGSLPPVVDYHGKAFGSHGIAGNHFVLANILPPGASVPTHSQPWLSLKNTACESAAGGCLNETSAYYAAIGAPGVKDTLDKFKSTNGFTASDPTAIYYNAHDLGLGREMHCHQAAGTDPDVACYVTNYGVPSGPPDLALAEAIAHTPVTATVGMEYSLAPGGTSKVVKFYVWDGSGVILNQATLDSEGAKSVPQICLVCHGGTYSEATHSVKNASFREFDIFSFLYSTQAGFTVADQVEQFRALNQIVKASNPNPNNANKPIATLIDGIFPAGSPPVETYVPPGWSQPGKGDLYTQIPRVYCRACHIAQTAGIDWTSYTQFTDFKDTIETMACSSRIMPHAEVPFNLFWTSPRDPAYLADPTTGLGFAGPCPAAP